MRTLIVLVAVLAVASAAGQFYVPRAYYTIDSAGHESIPVPLQRLRRSYNPQPAPQPYPTQPYPGSWSGSSSGANAWSNSHSGANGGGYAPPVPGGYGATRPKY
ncbi:hypothetical protein O0L34_g9669 [Tuta absoluta]|nr:hypothetical protein O0L34_g9669 [Tuta absoluta]